MWVWCVCVCAVCRSLVGIAPQLAGIKELTLQWIQATDADLLALSRHCKRITMLVLSLFL